MHSGVGARIWKFPLDRLALWANFGVPSRGLRLFEGLHRIGGEHCSDASLTTTPCRLKMSSPLRVSADRSLKTESESIVTYSGPASCNTKHGEGQFNRGSAEPQSESNTYKRESSGMSHQVTILVARRCSIPSGGRDTQEQLNSSTGEFDPGSERTLAAGLTHASRTRKSFGMSKVAHG